MIEEKYGFKIGDKVEVIRSYGGPYPVGHVGRITWLGSLANFCASVDDGWNFPIDIPDLAYLKKYRITHWENK